MNTRMSMCMEQNIATVQRAVTHMTMSIYKASQFILMSTLTGSIAMQTISMKSTIIRMLRNYMNTLMKVALTFTITRTPTVRKPMPAITLTPTVRKPMLTITITSTVITLTSCTCWMRLP